jgi:hypothetical protein
MKNLLDTHIVLWFLNGERLSPILCELITNGENYVSAVSLWEVAIKMKGKTAFITGGLSGIGRASSIAFAKAGANVFIIDIDDSKHDSVLAEINNLGNRAVYYKADVT